VADTPPIIIKKKGGHGGHHGGAWKVAYADFVTAMMALFIVLWLMNTSKAIQQAVGGYFKDPSGASNKATVSVTGSGGTIVLMKDNMEQLKAELTEAIRHVTNFEKLKSHVDMKITNEGLLIELTESASGTFFDSGSSKPNGDGRAVLIALSEELGKLPNKIYVEGHTDAKPYAAGANYDNWTLSAERANASRKLMQQNGLRPDQVTQVRGFADQKLRKPDAPLDPSNRRISLIVQYTDTNTDAGPIGSVAPAAKTEPIKAKPTEPH
jgi:chemotaxis protein MotB